MSLRSLTSFPNGISVNGYVISPQPNGLFDGPALDAFARQRVSSPFTLFDSKQIHDNLPLLFDDQEVSGGGTSSTHSAARASSVLAVTADTAGRRVRQTFQRFNYQPGKGFLIELTGVMWSVGAGISQRLGYYDDNNGVFFENVDGVLAVGLRSSVTGSPVDTVFTQENWSEDQFDGNGATGITLDISKIEIFWFDLQWLGAGRVRYGVNIGGMPYLVHEFNAANNIDSVYMSTPNLPVRYEIENDGTGGAASLEAICTTVQSEGGFENVGFVHSVGRDTALTMANNASWQPLMSVRLNPARLGATVEILDVSILCADSTILFETGLFLNPTIAGTDAVDWTAISNSSIQYDVTRDNTNLVSAGARIGGTLSRTGGLQSAQDFGLNVPNVRKLGAAIDGTPDEIVIAVRKFSGTTPAFYVTVNLRELQ